MCTGAPGWRRISLTLLCGSCLVIASATVSAGPGEASRSLTKALRHVSGTRMLADVVRLSSVEFNGRQAGTADDLRSGFFVSDRFKSLELQPALITSRPLNPVVKEWAMTESVLVTRLADGPALRLSSGSTPIPVQLGKDYLPILDSPTVKITAPVVFAGYGISDPEHGLDDYAGMDVRNRVVLFLRGKPEHYTAQVSHADKERTARVKGAAAILTAIGPILSAYEARRGLSGVPMASYSLSQDDRRLAGAWISTDLAETILANAQRSLRDIQAELNRAPGSRSGTTGVVAQLDWTSAQTPAAFYNFMAVLPGFDPALAEETIVIGAHRDHFGRQGGLLFPGADDNASGTAILLEIARTISQSGWKPKRSILFVSFSGEEQGLLGSRLYVNFPPRELKRTVAMINVDHAGVGSGRLTVGVTGLQKDTVAQAGHVTGLADKLDLFGFFPGGDHVPFKEAGVPTVTVVSGGVHPDLHQPSDRVDKVKPAILEAVARLVLALTWQLASAP